MPEDMQLGIMQRPPGELKATITANKEPLARDEDGLKFSPFSGIDDGAEPSPGPKGSSSDLDKLRAPGKGSLGMMAPFLISNKIHPLPPRDSAAYATSLDLPHNQDLYYDDGRNLSYSSSTGLLLPRRISSRHVRGPSLFGGVAAKPAEAHRVDTVVEALSLDVLVQGRSFLVFSKTNPFRIALAKVRR